MKLERPPVQRAALNADMKKLIQLIEFLLKKNSINNDHTQWYQIPSLVVPMRSLYIVYLFT